MRYKNHENLSNMQIFRMPKRHSLFVHKKGTSLDLAIPLVVLLVVAALFFLGFFGSKTENTQANTGLANIIAKRELLLFLETPVSQVSPNYKADFLASEKDTFADIIPGICDINTGSEGSFLRSAGHYYLPNNKGNCVDGKIFVDSMRKYFEDKPINLSLIILSSGSYKPLLQYTNPDSPGFRDTLAKKGNAVFYLPSKIQLMSENIKIDYVGVVR